MKVKVFVTNTYRSIARDSLEEYLNKILDHDISSIIIDIDKQGKVSEDDRKFMCRFLSYGIVGVILDWINSGMKADYQILMEKICKMLNGQIELIL